MTKVKSEKQKVKINISHVAKLANLSVGEKESAIFQDQLTKILEHVDKIEKADTSKVEPTYNVSPNTNITRGDNPSKSLTQQQALQNAPNAKDGFFTAKGVFADE